MGHIRDNIEVSIGESPAEGGGKSAVIHDHASKRAWSGEGQTESEAATEATRKFLSDRRAREYVG